MKLFLRLKTSVVVLIGFVVWGVITPSLVFAQTCDDTLYTYVAVIGDRSSSGFEKLPEWELVRNYPPDAVTAYLNEAPETADFSQIITSTEPFIELYAIDPPSCASFEPPVTYSGTITFATESLAWLNYVPNQLIVSGDCNQLITATASLDGIIMPIHESTLDSDAYCMNLYETVGDSVINAMGAVNQYRVDQVMEGNDVELDVSPNWLIVAAGPSIIVGSPAAQHYNATQPVWTNNGGGGEAFVTVFDSVPLTLSMGMSNSVPMSITVPLSPTISPILIEDSYSLQDNYLPTMSRDITRSVASHGTIVASQVVREAPEAQVRLVRVLNDHGYGTLDVWMRAMIDEANNYHGVVPNPIFNSSLIVADAPIVGYQPEGVIGDFIFYDWDGDGLYEPNDGEQPLVGIVVILEGADGSVTTTVTDEFGHYQFTDLPVGDYTVTVDQSTLPADKSQTPSADPEGDGDSTSHVTLTTDQPSNFDQDFGYPPAGINTGSTSEIVPTEGIIITDTAQTLEMLLTAIGDQGIVQVAAAGNESHNITTHLPQPLPGRHPDVIGVEATAGNQPSRDLSCYTNWGDVAWIGGGLSKSVTLPPNCASQHIVDGCENGNDDCIVGYDPLSPSEYSWAIGSSFASPRVAGIIAQQCWWWGGTSDILTCLRQELSQQLPPLPPGTSSVGNRHTVDVPLSSGTTQTVTFAITNTTPVIATIPYTITTSGTPTITVNLPSLSSLLISSTRGRPLTTNATITGSVELYPYQSKSISVTVTGVNNAMSVITETIVLEANIDGALSTSTITVTVSPPTQPPLTLSLNPQRQNIVAGSIMPMLFLSFIALASVSIVVHRRN